ncbi:MULTISPECIES: type II secretion system F family protein [Sphingomonas]|jgi:tight adherence protein C|uniref:Type II secretion system F family protein n=1 Tax=Sphingomonas zeae TaxID=1646122 RepID=A0A7Y6B775_9SPHN|nr:MULTISPECIES: type II secretion system F family protein [Sphingomonas]MBB4047213.1 tight adherence protein C [Sphingomonas zeae]MDK8186325.1 type II secretion system F family protein [Sphingomonas zeae]MDK8216054.1 type II secretion system F family protein [Sphingomonas sp. UMB7805-LC452B]NUU48360.1 type II secretion system F family protein [Sphingomonas zeae]
MTSPASAVLTLDPASLAALLWGICVFALLVAGYAVIGTRDPMARRVRALNERRELLKAGIDSAPKRRAQLIDRATLLERMRAVLSTFKMLQDEQVKAIQIRLLQAGIRSKEMAVAVIFGRLALPIVLGGTMALWVYGTEDFADWSGFSRYMIVAGTLVLSYKAPDLALKNQVDKRTAAIRKGLPDALDLMVICAEAGLTVDAAFARVARELRRAYPELGDEFQLTSVELGFLTDRRQALENLAMRVNLESLRGVVTTMIQTEKYGTPLASALRVLSAEFRHERMMRAEEKAARLPAIMTVPLILFILPVLFVVILGPAACSIKDTLIAGQ